MLKQMVSQCSSIALRLCVQVSVHSPAGRTVQENVGPNYTKTYPFNHIADLSLPTYRPLGCMESICVNGTLESGMTRCMS